MNSKVNMDPKAKLGFLERFAYGMGDYSGNLIYSSISSFLLVYYVSVLKVNPGVAASIMAVSKIFDGVSDLIMGRIVDNTKSKWGKARPWLIRMCIPLAVCTVLMFSVPSALTGKVQVAYMFLTYNLVSTVFYTAVGTPYGTLQGLMTTNQYERGLLGNFRMLLATAGTMTVNTFVMKICAYFGGGDQYNQTGWTITFILLGAVYVALMFFTFSFCRERVVEIKKESDDSSGQPSILQCLKSLVVNKYWILMVVFFFCLYFMMSTFFGSNYYFAQYIIGDESSYSVISNSLSMAQIAMMMVTPFIMKKIGKRYTALLGMAAAAVSFVFTSLAGSNVTMVVASNVLKGAAFGCAGAVMYGLLQDAITYGSWLTGIQAIGMGNAASSFCTKIGSGIGTAALGWILAAGKFDIDPTSASAATAINVACIWVPVIACVIGVVCMVLFDLDKYYDKIADDLAQGKYKDSKEN